MAIGVAIVRTPQSGDEIIRAQIRDKLLQLGGSQKRYACYTPPLLLNDGAPQKTPFDAGVREAKKSVASHWKTMLRSESIEDEGTEDAEFDIERICVGRCENTGGETGRAGTGIRLFHHGDLGS